MRALAELREPVALLIVSHRLSGMPAVPGLAGAALFGVAGSNSQWFGWSIPASG